MSLVTEILPAQDKTALQTSNASITVDLSERVKVLPVLFIPLGVNPLPAHLDRVSSKSIT